MKAYTDLKQSKKLAEILPIESADHHYVRKVCDYMGNAVDGEWSWPKYGNINSKYANYIVMNFTSYEKIPCWSLAALLDAIPRNLKIVLAINDYYKDAKDDRKYAMGSVDNDDLDCYSDNPIDACYEMIIKLHEQNLL